MTFSLPTQPETPHGLLRRSFELYQHAWAHVFFLSLLLSITTFLPSIISLWVGQDIFLNVPLMSIQRLWIIVLNFAILMFFVAILWRLHCVMIHKHESLEEDLKIGIIKIPSIFIAWIIEVLYAASVIFLLSAFTFYVVLDGQINVWSLNLRNVIAILFIFVQVGVALFIGLSFYFYLPLIVLENRGVFTALVKSFKLVWKHWWTTLYIQAIPWISYFFVLMFIRFVINLNIHIFFIPSASNQNLIDIFLNIILMAAFIPWIGTTLMVQLRDLELRRLARFKNVKDQDYPKTI